MYTIHSRARGTHFLIIHQYQKMAKNLQQFDKKEGMLILNSFIYNFVMICWGTIKRLYFVMVREKEGFLIHLSDETCVTLSDIQVLNLLFPWQHSNPLGNKHFFKQRRRRTLLYRRTWNVTEFIVRCFKVKYQY